MPENDIATRTDIEKLLSLFYAKVRADKELGYIFDGIAKVDWPHHLPLIANFWDSILLGASNYKGNPMTPHLQLDQKVKIEEAHFNRWLELFTETVDENFSGEKAEEAKSRARNIAAVMQFKIKSVR